MLENVISLYIVFTTPAGCSTAIVDPAGIWTTQNIVAVKVFARVVVVIEGTEKQNHRSGHDLPRPPSIWWAFFLNRLHRTNMAACVWQ